MPERRRTSKDMHWTVIILRDASVPPVTIRLPRCLLGVVLALVLLAALVAPALWANYQHWRIEAERVDELEEIILRQEQALAEFDDQMRSVEQSLEDVAELDRQLRAAIGLDPAIGASIASLRSPAADQAAAQLFLGAGPENPLAPLRELGTDGEQRPGAVEPKLWVLAGRIQDYLQNLLDLRSELGLQMVNTADTLHRWPVAGGYVSSNYGWRISPVTGVWQFHGALDIAAPLGTPIVASAPGTVIFVGRLPYYGETVTIRHSEEITTLYGHCNEITVSVGERVVAGQIIAHVGTTGRTTGPHLHWELHRDGEPVNPWPYLP